MEKKQKHVLGLTFGNHGFLMRLLGFIIVNEECSLTCFRSLNNRKM